MSSAGYARRALAWTIDVVVALVPLWMLVPVFAVMLSANASDGHLAVEIAAVGAVLVGFVLYFVIAAVQGVRRAPTVGARLCGLRRVDRDGKPPTAGPVAIRQLCLGLLPVATLLYFWLLPALLIGPVSALIRRDRRGIADAISGQTLVPVVDLAQLDDSDGADAEARPGDGHGDRHDKAE